MNFFYDFFKHDLIHPSYTSSSNGISFIIVAISTGVSTRKESKQSDQRLENLSSEQKQVHCSDYESLITISGEKKLNQDIIKLINIPIKVKCHYLGDPQSYTMYQTL